MPSFGEKLKLEREKRKISLDQISSSTKIGTRMLQALEEEKFSQLPGGIFNKGFVRAYARAVGLDEEQAVADYLQASGDAPVARPDLAPREAATRDAASREAVRDEDNRISRLEAISDEPSRPLPWGLFAVILLAIALLLSLWSHRRREREREDARPAAAGTTVPSRGSASPQATAPPAGGSTGLISAPAPPSSPTPTASSSLLSGMPVNSPRPDQGSLKVSAPAVQSSNASAESPGEFMVVIHAREESWVSVTVDGKPSSSELLEPGNERTFHARRDVSVKAGNAGALDFQLDGKKLEVGGAYGEVKSVTIGHAGLISNPSPPPTNP